MTMRRRHWPWWGYRAPDARLQQIRHNTYETTHTQEQVFVPLGFALHKYDSYTALKQCPHQPGHLSEGAGAPTLSPRE